MDYLQRIYRTDAERLCASHISNSRPDNGDAISERQIRWNLQLMREKIEEQREERIQDAYNRVRDALCANVQGGERLWGAHNLFLEFSEESAAQAKETGTWSDGFYAGRAGAYEVAASHMARIFELQYEEVSA